jgi:uncharacterized protein YhaN
LKIESIHIYGYGKLEDVKLTLSSFPVIYGRNEAGKSTIMSFIRSILFGFPANRQEKRYEPKQGGKYGGALTVVTEQYGRIKIERFPKTAAGEVTVYFADGSRGGEEIVQELMKGMDKALFDSIFAFDMHGLQNIHSLSEEDIGSYLFSAGTVGTDALLRAEKKLQKEMDALFKPNGRKPALNVMLQETAGLHEKVKKWQEQLLMYEELKEKKQQYEQRLSEIYRQKQTLERSIKDAQTMVSLQPLLIDKKKQESYLQSLSGHVFPADGLKRYDALQAELKPIEAQIEAVLQKKQAEQERIQSIVVDENVIKQAEAVEKCRLNKAAYDSLLQEIKNASLIVSRNEEEIEKIVHNLGLEKPVFFVVKQDTTLAAKEEVTALVQKHSRLTEQKHQLDERFSSAKETLEEYEEQVNYLQGQLLSEEERSHYANLKQQFLENSNAAYQEKLLQDLRARKNKMETAVKRKKKQLTIAMGIVFGLAAALLLFGFFINNFAVSLSGVFIFVLSIVIMFFTRGQETALLQEMSEEIAELERTVCDDRASFDTREAAHKLEKDEQIRQLLEREQFKLQQSERQYNRVVAEYEEWERNSYLLKQQIKEWINRYGLPRSTGHSHLLPAFEQIEKLKALYYEIQRQKENIKIWQEKKEEYEKQIYTLANAFEIAEHDISLCLYTMDKKLKEQQQQKLKLQQLEGKKAEREEELASLKVIQEKLQQEAAQLLLAANAQNEEEFRKRGQMEEEIRETKKQLSFLNAQIELLQDSLTETKIEEDLMHTNYKERLEELEQQRQAFYHEEQELQTSLAESKLHIASLEEGSTYADVLHTYELKKSQLREQAKKWAAYAVAKTILLKTKEQYHKERLPRTLSIAERYFEYLTEGEYKAVYAPNASEPFIVERIDGTQFYANELSQATAEQLYLSLRLALAKTYEAAIKYPLIIDDSFVNFDLPRTERALSLLQDIASERQIFFFTCHEHILNFFDKEQIADLTQNAMSR